MLMQVELEIMLPEEMSVKESHDIALMLQHKVPVCIASSLCTCIHTAEAPTTANQATKKCIVPRLVTSDHAWPCLNPWRLTTVDCGLQAWSANVCCLTR